MLPGSFQIFAHGWTFTGCLLQAPQTGLRGVRMEVTVPGKQLFPPAGLHSCPRYTLFTASLHFCLVLMTKSCLYSLNVRMTSLGALAGLDPKEFAARMANWYLVFGRSPLRTMDSIWICSLITVQLLSRSGLEDQTKTRSWIIKARCIN